MRVTLRLMSPQTDPELAAGGLMNSNKAYPPHLTSPAREGLAALPLRMDLLGGRGFAVRVIYWSE